MLNVLFFPTPTPPHLDILQAELHDNVELIYSAELPDPPDYEILIKAFPERADLTASPHLRAVIVPYTGPVAATRELMRQFPHIALHNLPYNTAATAETALALLLGAAKFVVKADRNLRQHDWTLRYSDRPQLLLESQTALIVGYGKIGRYLAPILQALNMQVLGVRRTLQPADRDDPHAEIHAIDALHKLLPRANYLILALPDTEETRSLIGAEELALLPPDAMLVNVGRGTSLDETALYEALQSGQLAGAGLDAWYNYPRMVEERTHTPPSQYPFHKLDNVVMSPHRAGWLGDIEGGRMHMLAEMLNTAASGQPMPNRVNVERGY